MYAPNTENFIVWNANSGEKLRAFKAEANDLWGSMVFSSDSSYVARSGENILSVYELPSMNLTKDS